MTPQVIDESVVDMITTKEELEEWRRKRAKERKRGGEPSIPNSLDPSKSNLSGWHEDIAILAQFLRGLKSLMKFLIQHRVPVNPSKLFSASLPEVEQTINDVISDLYSIDSSDHVAYRALRETGLTDRPLRLKFREYIRRGISSPVVAVLKMADRILGSLFKVFTQLEPVKEFKETLESRIEYDGDREIISLNLSGNEQRWNQAENDEE